ncbi:hypothetical protein F5X68DRAFT_210208, partial [Plectosphaerella plurivora]
GEVLDKIDILDSMPQATVDDVFNPDSYSDAYYRKLRVQAVFSIHEDNNLGVVVLYIAFLKNFAYLIHAERYPGGLTPWKGISFFLGGLTIFLRVLVWFVLGTPREIYFFFFVTIINVLLNSSFGFTPLETLLKGSTPYYYIIGIITLKRPNLRYNFSLVLLMMFSLIPAFTGMMALSLLPTDRMRWVRWGMYILQVFGSLPGLMIWIFLPSNVAGRTKKTVTSTVLFIGYCMFVASDAPKYIRGITACAILYCVEFCCMATWRFYYIWENRRRAKMIRDERLGKLNAEKDMTDRENIHFKYKY